MVRISLITLFTLVCACIAVYAIWTVRVSRQKSNDLLTEFRKADESLQGINDSRQNINKGTVTFKRTTDRLPEVELAIRVNEICRCIDSIKHDLALLSKQKPQTASSYPDTKKLFSLKKKLSAYNALILEKFSAGKTIKPGDLIDVDDVREGPAKIPWETYYFANSNVFAMITELTFINTNVLKLQHRAIN